MTREEAIKHFEAWAQCNYAPTRDAALMALSALRPVSREQVEKVWRGEWELHGGGKNGRGGICTVRGARKVIPTRTIFALCAALP